MSRNCLRFLPARRHLCAVPNSLYHVPQSQMCATQPTTHSSSLLVEARDSTPNTLQVALDNALMDRTPNLALPRYRPKFYLAFGKFTQWQMNFGLLFYCGAFCVYLTHVCLTSRWRRRHAPYRAAHDCLLQSEVCKAILGDDMERGWFSQWFSEHELDPRIDPPISDDIRAFHPDGKDARRESLKGTHELTWSLLGIDAQERPLEAIVTVVNLQHLPEPFAYLQPKGVETPPIHMGETEVPVGSRYVHQIYLDVPTDDGRGARYQLARAGDLSSELQYAGPIPEDARKGTTWKRKLGYFGIMAIFSGISLAACYGLSRKPSIYSAIRIHLQGSHDLVRLMRGKPLVSKTYNGRITDKSVYISVGVSGPGRHVTGVIRLKGAYNEKGTLLWDKAVCDVERSTVALQIDPVMPAYLSFFRE
eukprot:73170_1